MILTYSLREKLALLLIVAMAVGENLLLNTSEEFSLSNQLVTSKEVQ